MSMLGLGLIIARCFRVPAWAAKLGSELHVSITRELSFFLRLFPDWQMSCS